VVVLVLPLLLLGPLGIVFLGLPQSRFDLLDFLGRCLDAALRLLLEGVQHVDDASELDRVNGPVRLPIVVLDHFENPGPFEALKGLASGWLPPVRASKRGCPTVRRTPLGNIFRSFLLDATQAPRVPRC